MSSDHRLRVLIISDLFPNPVRYVSGIFVERQCHSLLDYCQQIVVAPVRVFPQLRIWKKVFQPKQLIQQVSEWQKELRAIPPFGEVNGLRVYYPRYTSLPKQGFHGTWGYFAYPFLLPLLRRLHQDQPFDLIHAHFASPAGLIARLCSRWMNVPVVLSVHGYDLAYTIKINALNRKIVINTFQEVDAILANSQKTLQGIAQYGIPKEKIHFVPLGADPEINVKVSNNHKEYIEILSVGNLYKQK